MKRIAVSMAAVVLALAVFWAYSCPAYALIEREEATVYKVTTRANLRETASINGRWIYTVPTGVLVVLLDEKIENSYCLIQYGEHEGYIYAACIKEETSKTYNDYVNQFPELFEEPDEYDSVNDALGRESDNVEVTDIVDDNKNSDDLILDAPEDSLEESVGQTPGSSISALIEQTSGDKLECAIYMDPQPVSYGRPTITPIGEYVLYGANGSRDYDEYEDDSVITLADLTYRRGSMSVPGMELNTDDSDEMLKRATTVTGTVTTRAKIRSAPSVESEQISSVPVGGTVTIIDGGENGYTHIIYEGVEGYVYSRCIEYESGTEEQSNGITSTVVVGEMMGSGDADGSSSETSGIQINVSNISAQRKALASFASAAMTGNDASDTVDETDEVELEEVISQNPTDTSSTVTELASNVISHAVNLRSLPDQESNKITTIPMGANVTVLGSNQGGYALVQYNGITGYVLEDCVVDSLNITQVATGDGVLFTCTAYCSCRICCGVYSPEVTGREAHTATGTVPQQGRTIAVDPTVIPYGTVVVIEGLGTFVAEDCGGAVKGNHIDIYFDNHEDALKFGTQRLYVYIQ